MLEPKRPAILRRPVYWNPVNDRSGILKWAGAFALVAIILAGVIGHYSESLKTPLKPQHSAPTVPTYPSAGKARRRASGDATAYLRAASAATSSRISAAR